jgi:hypothetical protein
MAKRKTKNALALIARDVGEDASFRAQVQEEKLNAQVAGLIHEARIAAKLTQKELADRSARPNP